jgi:hypothetical protein
VRGAASVQERVLVTRGRRVHRVLYEHGAAVPRQDLERVRGSSLSHGDPRTRSRGAPPLGGRQEVHDQPVVFDHTGLRERVAHRAQELVQIADVLARRVVVLIGLRLTEHERRTDDDGARELRPWRTLGGEARGDDRLAPRVDALARLDHVDPAALAVHEVLRPLRRRVSAHDHGELRRDHETTFE